jgi:hypothetical protein
VLYLTADFIWNLLRVAYGVIPVGFALAATATTLARTGHTDTAYLILAGAVTVGLSVAIVAANPRPRQRRSAAVRRINRRAATILVPAALSLATVMAILATAPAGLGSTR